MELSVSDRTCLPPGLFGWPARPAGQPAGRGGHGWPSPTASNRPNVGQLGPGSKPGGRRRVVSGVFTGIGTTAASDSCSGPTPSPGSATAAAAPLPSAAAAANADAAAATAASSGASLDTAAAAAAAATTQTKYWTATSCRSRLVARSDTSSQAGYQVKQAFFTEILEAN